MLDSSPEGLSESEGERRLEEFGPNRLNGESHVSVSELLVRQLVGPLQLLLLFAVTISCFTGQWIDASIVLLIVLASAGIGFAREFQANTAAERLRSRIQKQSRVLRGGTLVTLPAEQLVPGDLVLLSAGDLVPADGRLLETEHFTVNESVLTGESFPVEKRCGTLPPASNLAARTNCVFLGTNVRSGSARFVVVRTGHRTEFGAIAARLRLRPPETDFDRAIRQFGMVLAIAMLAMVIVVLASNVVLGRPFVETLLFSIALAVGLSPELLPAILSVNLARGAIAMGERGVLVRRLSAIENLGSMNILCTDKTGTLTEGVVRLGAAFDDQGQPSDKVLHAAATNAALQTGFCNPLDAAILEARRPDLAGVHKLAEIPYDFIRKRLAVIVEGEGGIRLITKGAVANVLQECTSLADGSPCDDGEREALQARCDAWNDQGMRVLAVATRDLERKSQYDRDDETGLTFQGFLTFLDRPKAGVREAIAELAALGVAIKVISGDSKRVCRHVAEEVGLPGDALLTGAEIDELPDSALWHLAERTDLFAEVDPNQKERIILSLRKMGHVVGFLGDGINDAPAMHASDTSLSVDQAVDVAREAADFVLLERSLAAIAQGIQEGRTTFANTLKYVLMSSSANLGNMISMAVASLFLPFLPLLAGQVLLNNFLGDIPAFALAEDRVDPEMIHRPRRWNMKLIVRFMTQFGLLSSLFDMATFAILLWGFHATPELFRTGWFVESMATQLSVILILRTRRSCFSSRPAPALLLSVVAVALTAVLLPYSPLAPLIGFQPLSPQVVAAIGLIAAAYVSSTEWCKRRFFRGKDL